MNEETTDEPPKGGKIIYTARGEKRVLHPENLEESEEEHDFFNRVYEEYKERKVQESLTVHDEDYADVNYQPYEWLIEVGTEYYYR